LSAREKNLSVTDLFARLPQRFSRAALLKNFPRPLALQIVARFSPADRSVKEIHFTENGTPQEAETLRERIARHFPPSAGFGNIEKLNYTDGVRITFDSGEIFHVRPSGNADELRVYAVADSRERAEDLAARGIAEPDGILRQMAKAVA
jgi:phosphomannomutase